MADSKKHLINRFLQELGNTDFLSIFDNFSDGVIVTNSDGIIVYYNRAMSQIDKLDPDAVISSKVTDVYELDNSTSSIMQCLTKGKPIIDEPIYYRTRMGKFANTTHNVMPLFNKSKTVGAICFIKDYNALSKTIASMQKLGNEQQFDSAEITFDKIIGEDPSFLGAINSAQMSASTPSPVMLFGETGTGKELFARAIHNNSSRSRGNYTPINCAAIPENLLEGILFGTSKGAFTGAVDKAGLFETTSNGTLFLDEINSMPLGLQSKILRSIQERLVRRVGALKEIEINVKIISSVNKDPHIAISDQTLRSDLFYRLGVVFIHLLPLRERMGDLELLVQHFIEKHNVRLYKNVVRISDEVIDSFKLYTWPGNVRELEHVIEGAMNSVGTAEVIRSHHLQAHFSDWSVKSRQIKQLRRFDELPSDGSNTNLPKKKSQHEEKIIKASLLEHKENISRTARSLGISRQLLYYKIKKFNINRDTTT